MDSAVRTIRTAVAGALSPHDRVVLAVSGGRDSMVMLDAARAAPVSVVVATYDHGTGGAATAAARLVQSRCDELRLHCVVGRAAKSASTEAAWREQRWRFLSSVALEQGAVVATAHTLDDQVETVFIRILREAGARGIAGLYAPGAVVRPLLKTRREEVASYAREASIAHVDDPSNQSRRHLRNRVRLDLLPAILARRPSFTADLLSLARRAAEWREGVAGIVDAMGVQRHADRSLYVARAALESYDERELAILWPEIVARAGVTMDRRGTHRIAAFTIEGATGGTIQLSGGTQVVMTREHFVVRRRPA